VWVVATYAVPAAVAWMVIGFGVNMLPLSTAALFLVVVYAAFYGLVEAVGRPHPAPPSSGWQVPSAWVQNVSKRRRFLVWGSILGPGFATRNPYAGFGLLTLTVAAVGSVRFGVAVAGAVGVAHGTARALALLRTARDAPASDYMRTVLKAMYWRICDGFALLTICGIAAVTWAYRF
jgi:hypothetical protein